MVEEEEVGVDDEDVDVDIVFGRESVAIADANVREARRARASSMALFFRSLKIPALMYCFHLNLSYISVLKLRTSLSRSSTEDFEPFTSSFNLLISVVFSFTAFSRSS